MTYDPQTWDPRLRNLPAFTDHRMSEGDIFRGPSYRERFFNRAPSFRNRTYNIPVNIERSPSVPPPHTSEIHRPEWVGTTRPMTDWNTSFPSEPDVPGKQ